MIVVVGDKAGHFQIGTVGEGADTTDLSLPGGQADLVATVVATGTPTVVVLLNGRPFGLRDLGAAAVLEAWFPGSGWRRGHRRRAPRRREPWRPDHAQLHGDRGRDAHVVPPHLPGSGPRQREYTFVHPFGHGLSYTTFEYRDLDLPAEVADDGELVVACTI